MTATRHLPVMPDRVVELLRPQPGAVIVDATLGLGGHTELLLAAGATVVGFDRDTEALALARERLAVHVQAGRLRTAHASFADIGTVLDDLGAREIHGVLYDLGVSSLQLDEAARGFSYRHDGPLDMRMDQSTGPSAADVVANYPVAELVRVLRDHADERFARRIAEHIDTARRQTPVVTTARLAEIVRDAVPAATRRTGPHPARRTFQALRIEVNGELGALRRSLPQATSRLVPGGRLVVMSYHSLEDRIVKRHLTEAAGHTADPLPDLPVPLPDHLSGPEPRLTLLHRRPEIPTAAEAAANPRAESAKLRAAEKRPSPFRSEGR